MQTFALSAAIEIAGGRAERPIPVGRRPARVRLRNTTDDRAAFDPHEVIAPALCPWIKDWNRSFRFGINGVDWIRLMTIVDWASEP